VPIDPRPHSLADGGEMACGRRDMEVANREFWLGVLPGGTQVSDERRAAMHPLRRLHLPRATAAEREEARQLDWDAFEQGLANLNRQRGG